MPTVPRPERQVSDAPVPGVRLGGAPSPESFGAGVGDTMIHVGARLYNDALINADRTATFEADRQTADLQTSLEQKIRQTKGKNVLGLDAGIKKDWDEGLTKIEAGLTSDRQRMAFDGIKAHRSSQLNALSQSHFSTEMNSFQDQETNAGISSAIDRIRANPDVPQIRQFEMNRIGSLASAYNVRKGHEGVDESTGEPWSSDQGKQFRAQAFSSAHKETIVALNDQGRDLDASRYFDANKDKLTAQDRNAVESGLKEGSTRGEAQRLVRGLLADGKTQAEILTHIDSKVDNPKIADLAHSLVDRHFREQAALQKGQQDQAYLDATNEIDAFHKNLPTQQIDPRMVLAPSKWETFTLQERNALDAYGKSLAKVDKPDRPNNDSLWLNFLDLTPEKVGSLSRREFDQQYWSQFDNHHRERAEQQWNTYKDALAKDPKTPDLKVTSSLTFKDQVKNAWNLSGLVDPSKEPSKWNQDEVSSFVRFENEAARALQQYEVTKLDGKRHATPDEVKSVIDDVKKQAVQKVFLPGTFYGYNERPAITLGEDELKQAVVPMDKIPQDSLDDLRRYIQSVGKPITEDKLRRAYAQRMLNNRKAFEAIVNE